MLLGLPCAGRAVGAEDVPLSWREDLLARFAGVQRNDRALPYRPFSSNHGPTKRWLLQFSADYMRDDADDATIARHLEAYILWLFGWIMFCSSQGDSCPKQLVPVARAIAETRLDDVPQFSWASAMLAVTYRGLCTGVTKVSAEEPIFVGCPLLIQLWSYERFPVGRPEMDFEPYARVRRLPTVVPSEDTHPCRAGSTRGSDRAGSGVQDVPPGARPELRYSVRRHTSD